MTPKISAAPERRIHIFFYGLFMDPLLLREKEITEASLRPAYADGFALAIGERATLVPAAGARAYGMLAVLTHDELERLYGAPGLESYRPEAILATTLDGAATPALCYNLRKPPSEDERNTSYAARLEAVLRRLDFPREYVESIRR